MPEKTEQHTRTILWSWENVYDAVYKVARDIRDEEEVRGSGYKFTDIIPVSRGGLIPGTILSHLLSIPIEAVIFPDAMHLITDTFSSAFRGGIIVDDICDTGRTFKEIKDYCLPYAFRVCLCAKEAGRGHYEAASLEYKDSDWLIFPWELSELPK